MIIKQRKIENTDFIDINNEIGMQIILCNLGASIYQLDLKNDRSYMESIILTPSNITNFLQSDGYFGKTIGRFAGRIKDGKVNINEKEYVLTKNESNCALHGGKNSLAFALFDYKIKENEKDIQVIFTYFEKENELPGDVTYQIIYQVEKSKNCFTIFFNAKTTKDTLLNLTNHTYFNLSGNLKQTILNHHLKLNCDHYYTLDENMILQELKKVNSIMDFTKTKKIGKHINDESLISHAWNGYDHCYVKKKSDDPLILILKEKKSKRRLRIDTSYNMIVMYTYNYPKSILFNQQQTAALKHQGVAFECQEDGLNQKITNKNEEYHHYIRYDFS